MRYKTKLHIIKSYVFNADNAEVIALIEEEYINGGVVCCLKERVNVPLFAWQNIDCCSYTPPVVNGSSPVGHENSEQSYPTW